MTWQPERPVQIVAGTPPGGGLDRVARALEKAIAATRLCNVPVEIVNVPGGGARKAWTDYIVKYPADGHVIGISSPNLTTDYLVGAASFEHSKYVPIATLLSDAYNDARAKLITDAASHEIRPGKIEGLGKTMQLRLADGARAAMRNHIGNGRERLKARRELSDNNGSHPRRKP